MKLPWQKKNDAEPAKSGSTAASELPVAAEAEQKDQQPKKYPKGYTPPKGRPTPKRRDQEIERGVIRDPNALSPAQAAQQRKELKKSMSKQEWKEYKAKERAETRERNRIYEERIAEGDERYLPLNDRGEEKRFARDWIDSRRWLSEWVMPVAFGLLIVMIVGQFNQTFSYITSLIGMILIVGFIVEAIFLARACNRAVRKKFPETDKVGWNMGFYAFSRASQPRRWRRPRPRRQAGENIT